MMSTMSKPPAPVGGIGRLLFDWRARNGYSQRDLAAAVNLSSSSMSNIEQGKQRPTLPTLYHLAALTKIPMEDLARAAGYDLDTRPPGNVDTTLRRLAALAEAYPEYQEILQQLHRLPPDRAMLAVKLLRGLLDSE